MGLGDRHLTPGAGKPGGGKRAAAARGERDAPRAAEIVPALCEQLPAGLFVYHLDDPRDDRTLRLLFVNKAAERLLGVPAAQLVGRTLDENFPGLRARGVPQLCAEVVRTRQPRLLEALAYGDERVPPGWYAVQAFPLRRGCLGVQFENITEQKSVANALAESEQRFRRLVESTTDYIFSVRVEQGRPVKTTHGRGCIAVTGYASEEYEADPDLWYRMIYEEDRGPALAAVTAVLAGESPPPFPHRIFHKDGSVRWVGVTLVPRFDEQHVLRGYDGLIRDITARKQSEELVIESERHLRCVLDSMNVGVFILDPQTDRITYANSSALKMIGAEAAQVVGQRGQDLIRPAAPPPEPATVPPPTEIAECLLVTAAGRAVPILKSAEAIEHKGKTLVIESFFNIEERKRAAEALRLSEAKYRIVADNTADWEFWEAPDHHFNYISPTCERITGYAAQAFEEDDALMDRIVHPEDWDRYLSHREIAARLQQGGEVEFRIVCRDGSVKWIAHACLPVHDAEGRFLGTRGSNRDATARKEGEAERERLIGALQDALSKVKLLSGFLPICASCKKIRDDQGYWNQIEIYIRDHSEAEFSHGLCPECARKMFPAYYKK